MTLEFTAEIPQNLPSSVPVFRLEPPRPGPASSARLAGISDRMGLTGRAHETGSGDEWTMHREGLWELGIHARSGTTIGRHRAKYQRPGERPFALADEEATDIAHRFVRQTELVQLDEMRPRVVTHLRTAGGEVKGEAKEATLLDAGVLIGRRVKDIDVDGPGGAVLVNVDPDGEVVGFRSIWRPVVDALDDVKVVGPDRAVEEIKQIAGSVRGDVEVTKATFGYFEQGLLDVQHFLQPAFALVYVVRDDEVSMKSAVVAPASDKLFEPLIGAKRFGDRKQPDRDPPSPRRG